MSASSTSINMESPLTILQRVLSICGSAEVLKTTPFPTEGQLYYLSHNIGLKLNYVMHIKYFAKFSHVKHQMLADIV